MASNFVGGIPFTLLYDSIKLAIRKCSKFKTQLEELEATLNSLQLEVLRHLVEGLDEVNLPTHLIEVLITKLREGKDLVDLLLELSVWNIRIWGNFCNCLGPDLAEQLMKLNTSLKNLIQQLVLLTPMILIGILKELKSTRRESRDQDDMRPTLVKNSEEPGVETSDIQAIASSSGGGGGTGVPDPALRVGFQQLFDVVIQAKVKNMMCKRLLQVFKSTLNYLQPLIEEVAEYNDIFDLSEQQVTNLIHRIKNGVQLVHNCSKVRRRANYRKFENIKSNILDLNNFLQRLFLQLKWQVERKVKEAMDSAREKEAVIKSIEGRGLLQIHELGRKGQSPGAQQAGPGDVIEETLVELATAIQDQKGVQPDEGESDLVPQMETEGSCGVETFDSATGNIEVGAIEKEGVEVVDYSPALRLIESEIAAAVSLSASPAETKAGHKERDEEQKKHSEAKIMMQEKFPEECLAKIISLTTPADACRLSSISRSFKSVADSDEVWEHFLPDPHLKHSIQSHSTSSSTSIPAKSKKESYLALCDNSVLIDGGKMSYSLDKWSGKRCYMVCARELKIVWSEDKYRHWSWISIPESKFEEVACLSDVCWLEIRGKIDMSILSPFTLYKACLVYMLTEDAYGFDVPVEVAVGARHYGFEYGPLSDVLGDDNNQIGYLTPDMEIIDGVRHPKKRADGWLEMELGEFLCKAEEEKDGQLEMMCVEYKDLCWKSGLIVQGIEVRPEIENRITGARTIAEPEQENRITRARNNVLESVLEARSWESFRMRRFENARWRKPRGASRRKLAYFMARRAFLVGGVRIGGVRF